MYFCSCLGYLHGRSCAIIYVHIHVRIHVGIRMGLSDEQGGRNSTNNLLKPPPFPYLLFLMVHTPIKLFAEILGYDFKLKLVASAAAVEAPI